MNRKITKLAALAGIMTFGLTGSAHAQGETGLVGIKLYDTGVRVVSVYGTPNDIQAVGDGGGGGVGPGGGRGPAGGGPGDTGSGGRSGGPGLQGEALGNRSNPFGFGDELLRQAAPGAAPPPAAAPSGGGAGDTGPGGRGGAGGGAAGSDGRTIYTRWVYNRGSSRYGFVMDKFNRVVQIEAIGMNDGRVRTSKGIGFGASFATIIRNYQAPDAYEISGDHIMVRYLVRNKVAFRLSRLQQGRPHVVTGVVVAAGKA